MNGMKISMEKIWHAASVARLTVTQSSKAEQWPCKLNILAQLKPTDAAKSCMYRECWRLGRQVDGHDYHMSSHATITCQTHTHNAPATVLFHAAACNCWRLYHCLSQPVKNHVAYLAVTAILHISIWSHWSNLPAHPHVCMYHAMVTALIVASLLTTRIRSGCYLFLAPESRYIPQRTWFDYMPHLG